MKGVWSRETNKLVLAPMVRIGTLPMRLLCLKYGASLVYTPEIVDRSIIGCQRVFNAEIGCWDYVREEKVIFRTHPSEKSRLIFQIGSANAEYAVRAAQTVEADVAGIDLNCGCPKKFSLQGGMGAALLNDEERLLSILAALVTNCKTVPVSCKIRISNDLSKTISLCKKIFALGVEAVAIHCRTPQQTPSDAGSWQALKTIADALRSENSDITKKPFLIANGDLFNCGESLNAFKKLTINSPFDGFMFARAAMMRPHIFAEISCESPKKSLLQMASEYLDMAIQYHNPFHNTKFVLLHIFEASTPIGNMFVRAKTYAELHAALHTSQSPSSEQKFEFEKQHSEDDNLNFPYVPDLNRHRSTPFLFASFATCNLNEDVNDTLDS